MVKHENQDSCADEIYRAGYMLSDSARRLEELGQNLIRVSHMVRGGDATCPADLELAMYSVEPGCTLSINDISIALSILHKA